MLASSWIPQTMELWLWSCFDSTCFDFTTHIEMQSCFRKQERKRLRKRNHHLDINQNKKTRIIVLESVKLSIVSFMWWYLILQTDSIVSCTCSCCPRAPAARSRALREGWRTTRSWCGLCWSRRSPPSSGWTDRRYCPGPGSTGSCTADTSSCCTSTCRYVAM